MKSNKKKITLAFNIIFLRFMFQMQKHKTIVLCGSVFYTKIHTCTVYRGTINYYIAARRVQYYIHVCRAPLKTRIRQILLYKFMCFKIYFLYIF